MYLHAELLVQQQWLDLRRQLHLLPVHVAGLCRSEWWEVYPYGVSRFKLKGLLRSEKWEVHLYGDSRFKLLCKCRSEKWELYLYGDKTIKVERVSLEVLPRGVFPLRFFNQLGNGSHHFWLCLLSERGMGMSMPRQFQSRVGHGAVPGVTG